MKSQITNSESNSEVAIVHKSQFTICNHDTQFTAKQVTNHNSIFKSNSQIQHSQITIYKSLVANQFTKHKLHVDYDDDQKIYNFAFRIYLSGCYFSIISRDSWVAFFMLFCFFDPSSKNQEDPSVLVDFPPTVNAVNYVFFSSFSDPPSRNMEFFSG